MTVFGKDTVANVYLPMSSCPWEVGELISDSSYSNITLMDFSVEDSEALDIRRCFDDVTHIFSFGRNIKASIITVSLICFLGHSCSESGGKASDDQKGTRSLNELRSKYNGQRLYMSKKAIDVKIGELLLSGFLVGMRIGNVDPSNQFATITFELLLNQET